MPKHNQEIGYLRQKINALQRALSPLKEVLISNPSQLEQDGAIQRFEYSFELTCKALKVGLNYEGFRDINSPEAG